MSHTGFNLFGVYGLSAVLILAGAWVYQSSPTAGGLCLFVGGLFASAIIISEITYKHMELSYRKDGFIER